MKAKNIFIRFWEVCQKGRGLIAILNAVCGFGFIALAGDTIGMFWRHEDWLILVLEVALTACGFAMWIGVGMLLLKPLQPDRWRICRICEIVALVSAVTFAFLGVHFVRTQRSRPSGLFLLTVAMLALFVSSTTLIYLLRRSVKTDFGVTPLDKNQR